MTRSLKRAGLAGLTGLTALALLTACGQAPTTGGTASGTAGSGSSSSAAAANPDYLPCVISDQGGFDDRSFNQQALEGVQAVAESLGDPEQFRQVQSRTVNDYPSNLQNLVRQDCNIIVAAGFALVADVTESATENTDTNFLMIDDNSIELDNVKSVVFNTNEAAFLAGYASAAYSKSGTVATFGGQEFPSVTIFMDGVARGIEYYNEQKSADVELLGWDVEGQEGTFVGNFTDQNKARTITQNFLDSDADVIIPVAGGLYQGSGAAIEAAGNDAVLVGVDADLAQADTAGYNDLFLTSILKNIRTVTTDTVTQAAGGDTFDNSTYTGTLENGGVGIAPFGDGLTVPDTLAAELEEIEQGIIDGSIVAESPSAFTS